MQHELTDLRPEHLEQVLEIFNHYVRHTFAAYPEQPVTAEMMARLGVNQAGYPSVAALDAQGRVTGFALLRPWHPMPTFRRAAEISYFVGPDHLRQGVGSAMLATLCARAKQRSISTLLANICAENTSSLTFHARQGFRECGRFHAVGEKHGQVFDVVWMQRDLE